MRITQAAIERLTERLGELPEVRLAFLFGSQVTGRAREESDIDVAVLLDPTPGAVDRRHALQLLRGGGPVLLRRLQPLHRP